MKLGRSVIFPGFPADSHAVSKASGSPAVGIDPPVEAEPHLRAVLERQPVVLTRVSKEGTFLAINEAGLSMLGAQSLEQVLGTSIMNMVDADDRKACQAFLDRAVGGQRGSFEVDLVGLTGARHTLELHGSVHPGAPDGIASILISFRDVTESRRLEQSLVEASARQAEQELAWDAERRQLVADIELARKAQSDQFAVDEQLTELERRLADAQDARRAIEQTHAEEIGRLKESLAEERSKLDLQLAAAARLDGTDQQLAELRGRYDGLESERQQLLEMAGLLRSEAEARQQTLNELTERLESLEAERQYAVDASSALRLDLDERNTLVADLTSKLQHFESQAQQSSASTSQLERELESRTALANELAGRIEQLEAEQAGLRESAAAEIEALRSASAAELEALRETSAAELEFVRSALTAEQASSQAAYDGTLRELQELQGRYATDTGALRDALNDAMGEQARLADTTAAAEQETAAQAERVSALEQELASARGAHESRITELEATAASRIGELEIRLTEAEQSAAARLQDAEASHAARAAEADAVHAARVSELEAAHAAQIAALEAAHAARLTELEAALNQATERADAALAAVQRAEEAFGAERQRLEDALLVAVDAEKAAKHALSTEIASRTVAERSHRQMQAAIERFAKEAGVSVSVGSGGHAAPAAPPKVTTSMRALASKLGSDLPRRLGDGLDFRMLASSADAVIDVDESVVVSAVGAFADSRRASMLSGQVTAEVAEVTVDEGVGQLRGMSPGAYALVALNIEGPGAQQGFPQEVFDSADPRPWREVKDELQSARTAVVGEGGQVWLTREGASIMIVEFYLPREGTR
jgi:PAS domain S-box-containing protein